MPPTMRADEIPVGWIGCVPHMRPPPPGGGCGGCVAGGTGKEQQKAIIRHSAALATSYIEYIEYISVLQTQTDPVLGSSRRR